VVNLHTQTDREREREKGREAMIPNRELEVGKSKHVTSGICDEKL